MALKTGNKGIELIKQFEGCKLKAYKCPSGVWTIGYGHTKGVSEGDTITQEEALNLLKEDLKIYEDYVNKYVTISLNQNQFDALVSFTYNCGPGSLKSSTLLRKLNQNEIYGASEEFTKWVKSKGKILEGLVKRRKAEQELFLTFPSYKIKVTALALNVRTGPGTVFKKIRLLTKGEIQTIVDEQKNWGKLETGGWISLAYTRKI